MNYTYSTPIYTNSDEIREYALIETKDFNLCYDAQIYGISLMNDKKIKIRMELTDEPYSQEKKWWFFHDPDVVTRYVALGELGEK